MAKNTTYPHPWHPYIKSLYTDDLIIPDSMLWTSLESDEEVLMTSGTSHNWYAGKFHNVERTFVHQSTMFSSRTAQRSSGEFCPDQGALL